MPLEASSSETARPKTGPTSGEPLQKRLVWDGSSRTKGSRAGFTLTEIALAMGIFAFALVGILGLLSVGLKNTRTANIQVSASNLLSIIASDIQASNRSFKAGVYTYNTPRLKITATVDSKGDVTSVTPASKILDDGGVEISVGGGNPLNRTFLVKLEKAVPGTTAIRVSLQWPASSAPGASPEGRLDALVPLPNL